MPSRKLIVMALQFIWCRLIGYGTMFLP